MEQMHYCAQGLCRKVLILQCNRYDVFNFVIIAHLIFMT
jgi:hypothetical protein